MDWRWVRHLKEVEQWSNGMFKQHRQYFHVGCTMLVANFGPESEARGHPRYAVRNFVSYCYGGDRFLTAAFNLGLGGMKIQTYHFLPEDEQLGVRLVLGRNSI